MSYPIHAYTSAVTLSFDDSKFFIFNSKSRRAAACSCSLKRNNMLVTGKKRILSAPSYKPFVPQQQGQCLTSRYPPGVRQPFSDFLGAALDSRDFYRFLLFCSSILMHSFFLELRFLFPMHRVSPPGHPVNYLYNPIAME